MRCLVPLFLVLSACGGGDDDGDGPGGGQPDACCADDPDAAGDVTSCEADRQNARFVITSTTEYGGFGGTWSDRPMPATLEEKVAGGGCAFWAPEPSFCDPPCEGATVCAVGGTCEPYPTTIGAGDLHVAGSSPELDLAEPEPGFGSYTTENHPSLFAAGDEMTLTGGGGDVDDFEITTRGVPGLTMPSTSFTATEHEEMQVVWDADESSPDGTRVVLHMDNDHHGTRAFVECWSDDSGELTVPVSVLDPLILAGESGIGTYIENAYMSRIARGWVATEAGCAAFDSESLVSVSVETVRAE
jgi:hypothetical protein